MKITNKEKITENIKDKKSILKYIKDILLDFIYPKNISCIICDNPIKLTNSYSICKDCFKELHFLKDACLKCGKPLVNHNLEYENIKDCPSCKRRTDPEISPVSDQTAAGTVPPYHHEPE